MCIRDRSSAMPSAPLLSPSFACTAGMRTSQFAVAAPLMKKIAATDARASRSWRSTPVSPNAMSPMDAAVPVMVILRDRGHEWLLLRRRVLAHREPIGPNLFPFLNHEPVTIEERSDLWRSIAGDLLKHRNQHTQRIVTHDGAPGDLADSPRLRHRDGETFPAVDVQHHVEVGASVADIDDAVSRQPERDAKLVDRLDLAVPGRHTRDGFDLAGARRVGELRATNVRAREQPLQRGVHHFFGRRGDDVHLEAIPIDALGQHPRQVADVALESDAPADLDE